MVKSKRTTGMTDIYGKLFDEDKPAVIAVFGTLQDGGTRYHRCCLYIPFTSEGVAECYPEEALREAFKMRGYSFRRFSSYEQAMSRHAPDELMEPQYIGKVATGQIPTPEFLDYDTEFGQGLIRLTVENWDTFPEKPHAVCIWIKRNWS